jgi:hypothetical protein
MDNEDFCREEYKQLSEDWRNRDRMAWQIPAFLVAIGGASIISAFSDLGDNPIVRNAILVIGLLFNWVFTIFLTRNTYLQGLGMGLLKDIRDAIIKGRKRDLVVLKQCARRVPLHTKDYKLWPAIRNFITPLSTVCLLSLCCVITGVLFQCLWCPCFNSMLYILWGILASLGNIAMVFSLSYLVLNRLEIVDTKGKENLRFLALLFFIPIGLIIWFGLT